MIAVRSRWGCYRILTLTCVHGSQLLWVLSERVLDRRDGAPVAVRGPRWASWPRLVPVASRVRVRVEADPKGDVRGQVGRAGCCSRPGVPTRARFILARGRAVGDELAVDHVGQSSPQAAHRLRRGLALGQFAR